MIVKELINHLTAYALQSPENGSAGIVVQIDDQCYEIGGASDMRGAPGEHFLAMIPNWKGLKFGVRSMDKKQ